MTNSHGNPPSTGGGTWHDLELGPTTYSRIWRGQRWNIEVEWSTFGGAVNAERVTLIAPPRESVSAEAWRYAVPVGEALRAGRTEVAHRLREELAQAPEKAEPDAEGRRPVTRAEVEWAMAANEAPEPRSRSWDYAEIARLYREAVETGHKYPVKYVRESLGSDPDGRPLSAADHTRVRGAVAYARKLGLIPSGRTEG